MPTNKAQFPEICHLDLSQEYYFKEGCYILEHWNQDQDGECSIARATVKPGVQTRRHQLTGVTERYLIQSGTGRVEIGDRVEEVQAGSVVIIPPQCPQRIQNIGDNDLVFLAICTPRFTPGSYEDLEG